MFGVSGTIWKVNSDNSSLLQSHESYGSNSIYTD